MSRRLDWTKATSPPLAPYPRTHPHTVRAAESADVRRRMQKQDEGLKSLSKGKCRRCGRTIYWARTPTGKWIPLDDGPTCQYYIVIKGTAHPIGALGKYRCHLERCSQEAASDA